MSEIKQRPVRDSNPNETSRLLENNTKIEYMSVTNRKRPVLDSKPNEIISDSNPNEIISNSNPNETTRQRDNHDIENRNRQTNLQTYQVCISSVFKNKWPPLKTF